MASVLKRVREKNKSRLKATHIEACSTLATKKNHIIRSYHIKAQPRRDLKINMDQFSS